MSVAPEAFTARVRAELQALQGVDVEVLRPLALRITVHGRLATLDLAAAHARACREPDELDSIIAHAARALPEAIQTQRLVPGRILPVLRTLEDIARITLGRGDAARPVVRPFLGSLVWTIVHDAEHSVRVCTQLDIDRLGLSSDGLWAQVRRNLARQSFALHGDDALVQIAAGGTYDASCLWHPGVLAALPDGTLAVAPARGVLLACPDPTPAARRALRTLAADVHRSRQHPLSLETFVLRAGAFAASV